MNNQQYGRHPNRNDDLVMETFDNESAVYNLYKEREEAKRNGFIATPESKKRDVHSIVSCIISCFPTNPLLSRNNNIIEEKEEIIDEHNHNHHDEHEDNHNHHDEHEDNHHHSDSKEHNHLHVAEEDHNHDKEHQHHHEHSEQHNHDHANDGNSSKQ